MTGDNELDEELMDAYIEHSKRGPYFFTYLYCTDQEKIAADRLGLIPVFYGDQHREDINRPSSEADIVAGLITGEFTTTPVDNGD